MEKNSSRLQKLTHLYLQQTISPQELLELLEYAKDPLFEHEIKEKLATLFDEVDSQALEDDEQHVILKNIFGEKDK